MIGALIVAGGVFLFSQGRTILTLTNLDRPRSMRFTVTPGERFLMFYVHSIYRQPVAEEFEVGRNEIVLRGVRTSDAGVMGYYGFDEEPGFQGVKRAIGPAFIVRMAMDPRQGVIVQGRKIRLQELGEGGDRIEVRTNTGSIPGQWIRDLRSGRGMSVGERP